MTAHSSFDTASLASRVSVNQTQWECLYVDRIYQICSTTHPGMAIELEAVGHVRDIIGQIVQEILDLKVTSVSELDRGTQKLLPKSCQNISKEAWDAMNSHVPIVRKLYPGRLRSTKSDDLHNKMVSVIKENMVPREKEKRGREKDKEIEKMAIYIIAICNCITDDIITWTGNYVKHIRNGDRKINLQNLKIALNADVGLMELTSSLNNDEDDSNASGFLSNFYDYDMHDSDEEHEPSPKNVTYDSIANSFLKDERLYLRELNQANVFRRRLEDRLRDDDKSLLKQLYGNLPDIHELTLKMERTLEDAIEMSDAPCIGMGLWELAEAYEFDGYLSYVMRGRDDDAELVPLTTVIDTSITELLTNKKYEHLFENESSSSLNGKTFRLAVKYVLPTLLHAPVLHFIRYVEYCNKLLRHCQSEEDRAELQNCKRSLASVSNRMESFCGQLPQLRQMMKACSDQSARNDSPISQLSRLQNIERSIDGFEGNPIGKTCSELLKEGQLDMVRPSIAVSPEVSKKGRWKTSRYLYLFDQLLVMCKKDKNHRFKYRTPVQMMDIVYLEDGSVLRNAFRLDIREKASSTRSYTMLCNTLEEKFSWMSVLVMATTRSILDRILDHYEKEEAKRIPLVTPGVEQYRFAEPDSEDNISFEDYTSSSGIPVVKNGTVLKLVERLTYHQYVDNKFVQTFLISYRSFCTPVELLELLMERFNVPIPNKLQSQEMRGGPLAGRFDTVQSHGLSSGMIFPPINEQSYQRFRKEYERPIQRRVLAVLYQWVKHHWYDFDNDPSLLDSVEKFLQKSSDTPGKLTNQHKKYCISILGLISKLTAKSAGPFDGHVNTAFDWDDAAIRSHTATYQPAKPDTVWHTAKKGDVSNYDLLTLHPLEIGRQLTMLHFDLYRAIKPIELISAAWTKADKYRRSPQLLKLTDHSTLLTYWVSRSIVETDSLEERVAMFSRVLEVMSVFEELHNFTGLVAFQSALNSSCLHRLSSCWERLDNEKQKCFTRFSTLCEPRYVEMQKRLQTISPPCVPFFGHYLTNIFFYESGNKTFVDPQSPTYNNKRAMVSFMKCRRISQLIREIQLYQNQPYLLHPEPSIRQFFESINPKSDFGNDGDALETYLYDRSLKIQPKDGDKAFDVKPKRPAHVLKSPGTKPTKSTANHYSSNNHQASFSTQTSLTVPSTPSHDSDGPSPRSALLTPPSDDMTVDAHPPHKFHSSDGATSTRSHPRHMPSPIGQLQPPPLLHPRTRQPPPPLHPRRMPPSQPASPPVTSSMVRSPPTPLSAARSSGERSPAFPFPPVAYAAPSTSPPLALPQRRSTDNEHLAADFDSSSSASHSPTVCLSVPLPPPALPPRRGADREPQQPPPLPPKINRPSASPAVLSPAPPIAPPRVPVLSSSTSSPTAPPPLPPKTYKTPRQSSGSPPSPPQQQ